MDKSFYNMQFLLRIKDGISDWLFFHPIDWTALAAIFTLLAVLAALGIAIWEHFRAKRVQVRTASQNTVVKIRAELLHFLSFKWDNFQITNPFCDLREIKKDFPIEYFQIKRSIRAAIEHSARLFREFIDVSERTRPRIQEIIGETVPKFLHTNKITYALSNEVDTPTPEDWRNLHWAGPIGGEWRSVTIYALTIWGVNFSTYLGERKREISLPNATVGSLNPSVAKVRSITLTATQSDELLAAIVRKLEKEKDFKDYSQKWRELYRNGEKLLSTIDLYLIWLSTQ